MKLETLMAQGPVDVNVSRQRCEYCDGTGDVTTIDGEYRGQCNCGAPSQFAAEMAALNEAYSKPHEKKIQALKRLRDKCEAEALKGVLP